MKRRLLIFLTVILFLFNTAQAQIVPADPGGNCPEGYVPVSSSPDDGCTPVPLDSGVIFLLAAGAAFGIKKIRETEK